MQSKLRGSRSNPRRGADRLALSQKGKHPTWTEILIYGASGGVGTFAVQLASRHVMADVTGVCSGANVDLVKSLGANQVIDYTRQDFTQSGKTYDVIFDAVANCRMRNVKERSLRVVSTSMSMPIPTVVRKSNIC